MALVIMAAVYISVRYFLEITVAEGKYGLVLPTKLISLALFGFFFLLIFSNLAAAVGYFYHARDLPLILASPVPTRHLYLSRLAIVLINSSWIFGLFGIPSALAYDHVFSLGWQFLATACGATFLFLLIPASISSIVVTVVVNVIPAHRVRDLIAFLALGIVVILFLAYNADFPIFKPGDDHFQELLLHLMTLQDLSPTWFPSHWLSTVLSYFLTKDTENVRLSVTLLVTTALGSVALGFLVFDLFFIRGWNACQNFSRARVPISPLRSLSRRLSLPLGLQLRAFIAKETRMFLRDTTQCMQLLMLLMLTFVYLYNFRTLRYVSTLDEGVLVWWQVVLCVANVVMGSCVVSAITIRFVFPSVSLEGRAFPLICAAPLTLRQILQYKFYVWLIPMTITCTVLFVSGGWAILVPPKTVIVCAVLAIPVTIGIVGLGIGIGAVYFNFDWESPTQVAASLGTLVYMALSLGIILVTLIPASFLIGLSCIPTLANSFHETERFIAISCSYILVFAINIYAAQRALKVGAHTLAAKT